MSLFNQMKIFSKIFKRSYSDNEKYFYINKCLAKAAEEAVPYIKDAFKEYSIYDVVNGGVGVITVFYNYYTDVADNKKNGISDKIRSDIYKIVKKYDKLNLISAQDNLIYFDSRQNVDEHYDGNLFFYYK